MTGNNDTNDTNEHKNANEHNANDASSTNGGNDTRSKGKSPADRYRGSKNPFIKKAQMLSKPQVTGPIEIERIKGPATVTHVRKNLYNAMTALDALDLLDDGLTLMIRIPGSVPLGVNIESSNLAINCYFNTTRISRLFIDGAIARMVGTFADEIACAHLENVKTLYLKKGDTPYTHEPPVKLGNSFSLIPPPDGIHPNHYTFSGYSFDAVRKRIIALEEEYYSYVASFVDWEAVEDFTDKVSPSAEANAEASRDSTVPKSSDSPVQADGGISSSSTVPTPPIAPLAEDSSAATKPSVTPPVEDVTGTSSNSDVQNSRGAAPMEAEVEASKSVGANPIAPELITFECSLLLPSFNCAVLSSMPANVAPEKDATENNVGPEADNDEEKPEVLSVTTASREKTVSAKETLISIGPETDAALDLLHISDRILPELYLLMTTFRSSRWVTILKGPEFGLDNEKAGILAAALLSDCKAARAPSKVWENNDFDLHALFTSSSEALRVLPTHLQDVCLGGCRDDISLFFSLVRDSTGA